MPIKCNKCDGTMKKGIIVDDNPTWDGYGQFQTLRHNGHEIKVEGKTIHLTNLTYKATEVIVVCPKCFNHYIMKDYNFEEANKEITLSLELSAKKENVYLIHIISGIIKNYISEIYNNQKNYPDSSEFASKAGDEYLKAAKTAEGGLKENLLLLGNVLKAKSFIRKVPRKSWYKKQLDRLDKNRNIYEVIDNLKNATAYYEKALYIY